MAEAPVPGVTDVQPGEMAISSQEPPPLMEHEPLAELLSQIPHKVQRGIKTQHEILELTCLDANHFYIALGSSVGIVFLYDRDKNTIERLRSENTTDSVASVCLHHGLDDLVAVGYRSGTIYVFQLPCMLMGHSKQLERFIVTDLHTDPLKCLTWSTNGMKLYSGDSKGCVGCTEVDFYEGRCKSSILLIEASTEIVQLHQAHKSLLVSTKHRCFVFRMDDQNRLVQVGSKDRKTPGYFGGCFIPAMCKPEDAQLYAARPGYRIWKASLDGTVNNTYMFKELLSQPHTQISVLKFEVTSINKGQYVNQFGPLLLFRGQDLVTWNETCLYVLDPDKSLVIASQKQIGFIKAVVVTEDEIFVLRAGTDRNLVRISAKPCQVTTSALLMQLQIEREEREKTEQQTNKVKTDIASASQQTPKTGLSEQKSETKSSKEMSPFKNILDKVKQIPKPAVLKDKIQEKFKSETKSGYTQPYVFEGRTNDKDKKRDISPVGQLPPVIKLDSPNLITIQLDINPAAGTSDNSSLNFKKIPSTERFSDLAVESSLETELCNSGNQSRAGQTGTGAFSALSRLQADHTKDELSDPIYKMSDNTDEHNVREPVKINIPSPQGNEDSIVFSRKVKSKPKKKKKGTKDKQLKADEDQDSVSIHSTTSIASDSSDLTPSNSNLGNMDSEAVSEDKTTASAIPESNSTKIKDHETTSVSDVAGEGLLRKDSAETPDEVSKLELAEVKELSQNKREGCDETKPTVSESKTVQIKSKAVDTDHKNTPVDQKAASTESQNSKKSELETVDTHTQSLVDSGEYVNKVIQSSIENSDVTNLDKEMARLDSYLSASSESTDLEKSTSGPNLRAEWEKILFKDKKNQNSSYEPSRLEKELSQLDMDSMMDKEKEVQPTSSSLPVTLTSPKSPSNTAFQSIYSTPSTSNEDFYSKYSSKSPAETSPATSDPLTSIGEKMEDDVRNYGMDNESADSIKTSEYSPAFRSVNTWTEFSAQGNIHSLSVSNSHVWITDRSNNIYYSALSGPGLSWKKASGTGSQISVSKYGNIIWCLNKNTVYAGTKITARRPEGMKWVEAVRDVAYMCVDETCAWYIKTSHEVMIQKGLSRDRPCYTGKSVDCTHRLKQIVCQSGVVWALTENCQWLYRSGITQACPEGTDWKSGDSGTDNNLFSYMSLGDGNVGWAMDVIGQVWFCCWVTMATPRGDNKWWQVPFCGEYLINDPTTMDMLKSFSKKFDPQKLTVLLSTQCGGLVSGVGGVWVCPEYKNVLHACRGSIVGHIWSEAHPVSLTASSAWKTVVANNAAYENGVIWAQQPSSDIFAFSTDRQVCSSIPGPTHDEKKVSISVSFVRMSVCADALWCLTAEGDVYIRTGMSPTQPTGSGWSRLDLSQLDESHLVHVSCGQMNVWAVDSDGNVFHRIGVKAPSDRSLNAAWLPVDNGGTVFTQVIAGSQDWKVWAIDNRRQVYVRDGITANMPIGRKWVHVSGTPAMQITLSDHFVWALNHAGELLCRHGVSVDNVTGDYWKKLPGALSSISASPDDTLWGINKEGQLVRRDNRYIIKNTVEPVEKAGSTRATSVGSEEGDWEFV